MKSELHKVVAARWVRLGAMLNVDAAAEKVDLERLLLDTVRVAGGNSRLFILAASWLARFGDYVAGQRLARLISDQLETEHRPAMGLLLEWANGHGKENRARFKGAIEACGAARDARPLFDVDRRNRLFVRLAEQKASVLSRKWGRWAEEFEVKDDALRPVGWIAMHNPALADRALVGGVGAGVLAELDATGGRVESEAALAYACCASRAAVSEAVDRLQRAGRVQRIPRGKANAIEAGPLSGEGLLPPARERE